MRTDKLREEFDLNIRWSVFPLHPETPEDGGDLHDLFAGRMDVDAVLRHLYQLAEELGLPIGKRTNTYNSRRAQELGIPKITALVQKTETSSLWQKVGLVDPTGDFDFFNSWQKIVMVFLMWLGRLEFFAVLALLHPRFWTR